MASINVQINGDYGYVILVMTAGVFIMNYLGMRVVGARKKYGVQYPTMYSATSDAFNCYQRAHQNALETYPLYLALLLIGGIQFPQLSAICGVIFLAGKLAYAHGYYSGNPEKRMRGAFGYIGLLGLIGFNIAFALNLLGVV